MASMQEQDQINAKNRLIAQMHYKKDIGKTICNERVLSHLPVYTYLGNLIIKQTNGTVIASVEGFSNDQKISKSISKAF
jgi:hypothetical protein